MVNEVYRRPRRDADTLEGERMGDEGGPAGPLDAFGKLPLSQVPASAITDVYVVADQTEMLALPAGTGDVAKRTDLGKSFILQALPPTVLGNWIEMTADYEPLGAVATHSGLTTGVHGVGASTVDSVANRTAAIGAHAALPDVHHAKSHVHDGIDGSGTLAQDTARKEPTGFESRSTSTIGFVAAPNRRFTITGTNFVVWIRGIKFLMNTEYIDIANTTGLHFIYYNAAGILTETTSPPTDIFQLPLIATVFWNANTSDGRMGDERHGIVMDGQTHELLHKTVGVRYGSGLTGVFDDTTLAISSGDIWDEDIEIDIGPETTCRVFYRASGTWTWTAEQTKYYYDSGGNIYWDNAGTIQAAGANQYVAYWVFATNDPETPIYVLMGQRQDGNITDARNNNKYESLSLTGLPFQEMKLLYRVIVRNDVTPYEETLDLRTVSNLPAGTYLASAHNLLTGLDYASAGHTGFQGTAEKNQPNGYAGLDGSSKLAGTQQTYGALANTACEGNDARLSDNRTDADAIHKSVAAEISGLTGKTTPVDADVILGEDSASGTAFSKIKITWANIKATLKTYFDTLYATVSHTHAATDITTGTLDGDRLPAISTTKKGGVPATGTPAGKYLKDDGTWATVSATDSDAIHDNVAGEISAITEKTAPVDADLILIEDSEDSNNKKKVQISKIAGDGHVVFNPSEVVYSTGSGNSAALGIDGTTRIYLEVTRGSGGSAACNIYCYTHIGPEFKSFPTNALKVMQRRTGTLGTTTISMYKNGTVDSTINASALNPGTSFASATFTPGSTYAPGDEVLIILTATLDTVADAYAFASLCLDYDRKVG